MAVEIKILNANLGYYESISQIAKHVHIKLDLSSWRRSEDNPPPTLYFCRWHEMPANFLWVFQETGLDGFVFARGRHV